MTFQINLLVAGAILLNIAGCVCQSDVCGKAALNTKIVGGGDATSGSWPWQVSIQRISTGSHFCGGSIINKDWILSAAHCFQSISPSNIKVSLGRQKLSGTDSNEISRKIDQIFNHPNYYSNFQNNDIALLKLSSSVLFTNHIQPICLAAAGSTFGAGTKSWITGWGKMNYGETQLSNTLQEVQIPIVSNTDCNKAYGGRITSNMICAGLTTGGKDSCQGDSGGPMVYNNGALWIQSGVVNFGKECALPGYPGVYARVSQYQSWINSHINSDQPGFIQVNSTVSNSSSLTVSHTFFILLSSSFFSLFKKTVQ
ncbi:trypsin-2-like [Triplophysa dalaica]|uniref:trypsin-2-like n=1 Tax=Triplophysa dalaica TaxID=1582913 RepID=UPI0024DF3DDF|nr:trypsin-2-like [Triplophysa dalaica]